MKNIGKNCLGLWQPTPGSLYPALEELLNEGLIELRTESKTGRKKKVYKITSKGKAKIKQMQNQVEEIEKNALRLMKDPELKKYNSEDAVFLFKLIHNSLNEELAKYKCTLLEFAMLARQEKISKKQSLQARKAFGKFLEEISKINKQIVKEKSIN